MKKGNQNKTNDHTQTSSRAGGAYQFAHQRFIRLIADITGYGKGEKWPNFQCLHSCVLD